MPREPLWEDPLAVPPVLGLAVPKLPGRVRQVLGNVHSHYVVLDFGDPRNPAGPFLSVTSRPADRRRTPVRGVLLEAALLSFAARLSESSTPGADPHEAGLSPLEHATILVEETRAACVVRRQGDAFAAHVYLSAEVLPPGPGFPGTFATIVARGVELSEIRLTVVSDLSSFAALTLEHAEQEDAPPGFAQACASIRFGAIERLILTSLENPDPAGYAEVRRWMMELRTRWTEAHRSQMHFTGQDAPAAAQALMALLDQMKALSSAVPWWQEAGTEAVAESIRHAVFASDVPSRAAQDLWCCGIADPAAEARWLQAWQRWYSHRNNAQN